MIRASIIVLAAFLAPLGAGEAVRYEIDLVDRSADSFTVRMQVPPAERGEVFFQMAATVPGTYQIQDWGTLVERVEAFDAAGGQVAVERVGDNRWRIADGGALRVLRWVVDDTYDHATAAYRIYPMAGTNIEADNVVINHFGILGYLDDEERRPIEIRYRFPASWRMATALDTEAGPDAGSWTARARDFHHVAASPLIAGDLVIGRAEIDEAAILWASRNPSGGAFDDDFMRSCFVPVVEATRSWLGRLPTDRYAFLVHARAEPLGMMGALEHPQSSLYFVPAVVDRKQLQQIAAHEFFHVVTPLNIHSHLIEDFDFADPRPPRHLWFYEGMVEYASHLILRRAGLVSDAEFVAAMQMKFVYADAFARALPQPISLIELSEGTLGAHRQMYMDIYMRGALVAMAVDLELRRLSDGARGLRELIRTLLAVEEREAFDPDAFFGILAEASGQPELLAFLERHVAAPDEPPYEALLAQAGFAFTPAAVTKQEVTGAAGRKHGIDVRSQPRLVLAPAPTAAQLAFREAWLGTGASGGAQP